MNDYSNNLKILIQSGCTIVEIVSYEWQRIHAVVNSVAEDEKVKREWLIWSTASGIRKWNAAETEFISEDAECKDPMDVLKYFQDSTEEIILILEDFHPYCTDRNPEIVRVLREITRQESNKTLILSQPFKFIPEELSKDVALLEIELPTKDTIKTVLDSVISEYIITNCNYTDKLLEAALGLTAMEAKLAFSKAAIKNERLTDMEVPLVIGEKENIIKKDGLLEYYHPDKDMNNIGGLDNIKEWIEKRGYAFSKGAKDYGLNTPRGMLLLGVPGCGKSLTAKAIAKAWNFPLLRFDLGKVFAGIVGESERNIRQALDVAKAISPCVLWIDEIEKGFSGVQGSGSSDGGTTSRIFGTFLTWMQEKKEPVFVIATANDISLIPPELLRKGRFDEIFFVDLPSREERINIFSIHLKNKNREAENFDLKALASASKGFSGAEIEEVVNEALFNAFYEKVEIRTEHILEAIKQICPLSKTMAENITKLRSWAKVRARLASKNTPESLENEEETSVPKLKQEAKNPFM
jgi:ATP-dependent 26S proteasome regulatory subunit